MKTTLIRFLGRALVVLLFSRELPSGASSASDAAAIALGVSLVTPIATAAMVRSEVLVDVEVYIPSEGNHITFPEGTPLYRLLRMPAVSEFNAPALRNKIGKWLDPLRSGASGLKTQIKFLEGVKADPTLAASPLTIDPITQLLVERQTALDRMIGGCDEYVRVYDAALHPDGLDAKELVRLTEIGERVASLASQLRDDYPAGFVGEVTSWVWAAANTGDVPPPLASGSPREQLEAFFTKTIPDVLNRKNEEAKKAAADALAAAETEEADAKADQKAKADTLGAAQTEKASADKAVEDAVAEQKKTEATLTAASGDARTTAEVNNTKALADLATAKARQTAADQSLAAATTAAQAANKNLADETQKRTKAASDAALRYPKASQNRAADVASAMSTVGFPMTADRVFELQGAGSIEARLKLIELSDPMTKVVTIATSIALTFNAFSSGASLGPLANEAIQTVVANDPMLRHAFKEENGGNWRRVNYVHAKGQAGDQNVVVYFENPLTPVLKSASFDPSAFQLAAASAYEKAFSSAASLYGLPAGGAAGTDASPYNLSVQAMQRQQLAGDRSGWRTVQLDALKRVLDTYAKIKAGQIEAPAAASDPSAAPAAPAWKTAPSAEANRSAALALAKTSLTEIAASLKSP